MIALRWILGIAAAVVGGGFIALSILGGGFRKSFGASETHPLGIWLPLLAFAPMVASLVAPTQKPLLHLAAVSALAIAAYCVWQIVSESANVLWVALLYLGLWFVYYLHAAWEIGGRG